MCEGDTQWITIKFDSTDDSCIETVTYTINQTDGRPIPSWFVRSGNGPNNDQLKLVIQNSFRIDAGVYYFKAIGTGDSTET
jgi:hypothetical protein